MENIFNLITHSPSWEHYSVLYLLSYSNRMKIVIDANIKNQ